MIQLPTISVKVPLRTSLFKVPLFLLWISGNFGKGGCEFLSGSRRPIPLWQLKMWAPKVSLQERMKLILSTQNQAAQVASLQQKYIDLLEKRIGQLEKAVKSSDPKATEGDKAASDSDSKVYLQ